MYRIASLALAALALPMTPALAQTTPLAVDLVGFGFQRPIDLQVVPGDRTRLFVAQQDGTVWIIKSGRTLSQPYMDLRTRTLGSGERGLLGLAFHPDYANNGYVFVHYTQRSSGSNDTIVDRYTVSSANPDMIDPTSVKRIFGPINQPYPNHNGGWLAFGPDGYLWLSLGDGGSSGDPLCRAQNGQSLLGKMLRFDIDTATAPYLIPPSNPFRGNSAIRDEIVHLGLRNAWRCAFDRVTGELYLADVGQGAREEISHAKRGQLGLNYGWKIMEGDLCYSTRSCPSSVPLCRSTTFANPIHVYSRTSGVSVTGGYVYRGCAIPDLKGTYFFADYWRRNTWTFRYANNAVTQLTNRNTELTPRTASTRRVDRISSFGEDNDGEIYICDYSDGEIWKIVPRLLPPVRDLGNAKAGVNGVPKFDACGLLYRGRSAAFSLSGAAKQAPSVLVMSASNSPVSLLGGTLVPWPPLPVVIFPTDPNGDVNFDVNGGTGVAGTAFAQFLIFDQGATQNWAFSNALQIDFR